MINPKPKSIGDGQPKCMTQDTKLWNLVIGHNPAS